MSCKRHRSDVEWIGKTGLMPWHFVGPRSSSATQLLDALPRFLWSLRFRPMRLLE